MHTKRSWNKKDECCTLPWTKQTYLQLVGSVLQAVKLTAFLIFKLIDPNPGVSDSEYSHLQDEDSHGLSCSWQVPLGTIDFLSQPSRLFRWSIGDRTLDCLRGWCDLLASFLGGWLLRFHEDRLGRIWMMNSTTLALIPFSFFQDQLKSVVHSPTCLGHNSSQEVQLTKTPNTSIEKLYDRSCSLGRFSSTSCSSSFCSH